MITPNQEGRLAFGALMKKRTDNPHPHDSIEHKDWDNGYRSEMEYHEGRSHDNYEKFWRDK